MAIAPFPHTYAVTLVNDQIMADGRTEIRAGAPPEFGGNADVWSPEHLLAASALLCLKTTFDAYARRQKVQVHGWRGSATLTLVKGRVGPDVASIDLVVELVTEAGDEARAQATLESAERDCIVKRALAATVHLTSTVTSIPTRAAG